MYWVCWFPPQKSPGFSELSINLTAPCCEYLDQITVEIRSEKKRWKCKWSPTSVWNHWKDWEDMNTASRVYYWNLNRILDFCITIQQSLSLKSRWLVRVIWIPFNITSNFTPIHVYPRLKKLMQLASVSIKICFTFLKIRNASWACIGK